MSQNIALNWAKFTDMHAPSVVAGLTVCAGCWRWGRLQAFLVGWLMLGLNRSLCLVRQGHQDTPDVMLESVYHVCPLSPPTLTCISQEGPEDTSFTRASRNTFTKGAPAPWRSSLAAFLRWSDVITEGCCH